MASGIYGTVPVIAAWIANNSEPHYTRATSIALGFMATSMVRLLAYLHHTQPKVNDWP